MNKKDLFAITWAMFGAIICAVVVVIEHEAVLGNSLAEVLNLFVDIIYKLTVAVLGTTLLAFYPFSYKKYFSSKYAISEMPKFSLLRALKQYIKNKPKGLNTRVD